MESLPIDMNNPQVRDYLSLVRLQVLTPLSLLINIATVMVCALVVNPSLGAVTKLKATSISPKTSVIAVYVAAIYVGQIGYCILLVLAGKPETKKTLIKGVGFALVIANWVMAAWAISWVFQWFLFSTILQGLLLLLLIYSNLALLIYHPPTSSRPLDMALIHAPMRFFLILPFSLTFPYSLFVTLGMVYRTTFDGLPVDYTKYAWPGFGVVLGTNLLGLAVVVTRRDLVWCVAATWIAISIWSKRPKPGPVYITAILFTVLHPLSLFASIIWQRFYARRAIALPDDGDDIVVNRSGAPVRAENPERRPREVDAEAVWG